MATPESEHGARQEPDAAQFVDHRAFYAAGPVSMGSPLSWPHSAHEPS